MTATSGLYQIGQAIVGKGGHTPPFLSQTLFTKISLF